MTTTCTKHISVIYKQYNNRKDFKYKKCYQKVNKKFIGHIKCAILLNIQS